MGRKTGVAVILTDGSAVGIEVSNSSTAGVLTDINSVGSTTFSAIGVGTATVALGTGVDKPVLSAELQLVTKDASKKQQRRISKVLFLSIIPLQLFLSNGIISDFNKNCWQKQEKGALRF
jgi:hypothetical protein